MSLTLGTGPLAAQRRGRFDCGTRMDDAAMYLEPLDRRVRGYLGGQVVVESTAVRMLHRVGEMPQWWFPGDDLRDDVFASTGRSRDDELLGALRLWDARLGRRTVTDVAHHPAQTPASLPALSGLVAVRFDALDRWLEEDDEVVGHPRDPYHRVDTRRSSQHVVVRVGDQVVAESRRPVKLFETSLPVRWYVPREDVRADVLSPSLTRTICPYKGIASYHSLTVGETVVEDGAWYYPDPLGEALQARDHLSFLGDGVEVRVDGVPVG